MIYKKNGHTLLKSLSLIAVLLSFCSIKSAAAKTFKQPLKHPYRSEQRLIAAIQRYAAASSFDPSTGDMNIDLEAQKAAFNSIKQILKNGTSANTKKNGLSALQLAILTGSLELVKLLLEYKANPNYVARDGITQLVMALNFRESLDTNTRIWLDEKDEEVNFKIIEALINAGAKVNMAIITKYPEFNSTNPQTRRVIGFSQIYRLPLEIAIENNDTKSKDLLEKKGAVQNRYALIEAVKENNSALAQSLIHTGIDLNLQNENSFTALMFAILNNNPALVQDLIKAKANINLQNWSKATALIIAANLNKPAIAQALIAARANLNLQDIFGNTALIVAAGLEDPTIAQDLIATRRANVNLQNKGGDTALFWAAFNDDTALAQALIKAGADVNIQDNNGKTALNYAKSKDVKTILETAAQAQNAKPKS